MTIAVSVELVSKNGEIGHAPPVGCPLKSEPPVEARIKGKWMNTAESFFDTGFMWEHLVLFAVVILLAWVLASQTPPGPPPC